MIPPVGRAIASTAAACTMITPPITPSSTRPSGRFRRANRGWKKYTTRGTASRSRAGRASQMPSRVSFQ